MRKSLVPLAALGLLASMAGAAQLGVGESATMPEAKESIGLANYSAKALEGKVVYLEIFRTWWKPCQNQVGHLDEMWAKYKDRGLVVLAVTDEPRGLVDKFIEKTGAKHPIVIESGDSLREFGGNGFPTIALIDPRGRVAVAGMPQEQDIERLLGDTWTIPELPKKLAPVHKSLEKGDYAGARKTLDAQLAGTGLEDADRKAAEGAVKWIEERGAKMLAAAEEDEKSGDAFSAAQGFRRAMDAFKGAEVGNKADAALKALLADKAKKREVDAGEMLEKNRAKLRTMKAEAAAAWCRSFVKSFEGTKAAVKAGEMATGFEAAGKK